jgi:hypothetical protein
VKVAVMQIYLEVVEDLLAGNTVAISHYEVQNLYEPAVTSAEETIRLIQSGIAGRKVGGGLGAVGGKGGQHR